MDTVEIYVVDDDPDELERIRELFEDTKDEKFHFVEDVNDFLEKQENRVDVAVIDHYFNSMPRGMEIMLKIMEANPAAWVIILSGSQEKKMVERYLNADAFRFVDKNDSDYRGLLSKYVHQAINRAKGMHAATNAMHKAIKRAAKLTLKNGSDESNFY